MFVTLPEAFEKGAHSPERPRTAAASTPEELVSGVCDALAALGCEVAQIAKSIIFRAGERAVLVIASGANRVDMGKSTAIDASIAKVYINEATRRVTDTAMQLRGSPKQGTLRDAVRLEAPRCKVYAIEVDDLEVRGF